MSVRRLAEKQPPSFAFTPENLDWARKQIAKYPWFESKKPWQKEIDMMLSNGFKIYHMGDTGLFTDMKFIGEKYKPDLLLIPIGGHFVMDPADAAFATKEWIKPKMVLPMHYGTNPFLKGTPEQFKAALGQSTIQVLDMQPGDVKTF